MIDTFQELKLKLLKSNLKQSWSLPNEIWNEEIPHDYMYEDTYLQLSFVLFLKPVSLGIMKTLLSLISSKANCKE